MLLHRAVTRLRTDKHRCAELTTRCTERLPIKKAVSKRMCLVFTPRVCVYLSFPRTVTPERLKTSVAAPPKFLGLVHERLLLSKAAEPENILSSSEDLCWGEGQGGACGQGQQLL